jgi:hypothetical protein
MFSIYRDHTAMVSLKQTWEQAAGPLREAILDASRRLDQWLHANPHEQGESRDDKTRILFEPPLAVLFEVDEPNKLVRILRAWAYRCSMEPRANTGE